MKLNLKVKTAKPRIERIKLNAELTELFDRYLQFYQQRLNATLNSEYVIAEMMQTFMESDRDFNQWNRQQNLTSMATSRTVITTPEAPSCVTLSSKKSS